MPPYDVTKPQLVDICDIQDHFGIQIYFCWYLIDFKVYIYGKKIAFNFAKKYTSIYTISGTQI